MFSEVLHYEDVFFRMAKKRERDIGLPPSLCVEDLVQEALIVAAEKVGCYNASVGCSLKTFLTNNVNWHWQKIISESHVGPSAAVRSWMKKSGKHIDYGEISLDAFAPEWVESLLVSEDNEIDSSLIFSEYHIQKVIEKVRSLLTTKKGICFAKSRGKWHVQIEIGKAKHFLGQFKTEEEAVRVRRIFLLDFEQHLIQMNKEN